MQTSRFSLIESHAINFLDEGLDDNVALLLCLQPTPGWESIQAWLKMMSSLISQSLVPVSAFCQLLI